MANGYSPMGQAYANMGQSILNYAQDRRARRERLEDEARLLKRQEALAAKKFEDLKGAAVAKANATAMKKNEDRNKLLAKKLDSSIKAMQEKKNKLLAIYNDSNEIDKAKRENAGYQAYIMQNTIDKLQAKSDQVYKELGIELPSGIYGDPTRAEREIPEVMEEKPTKKQPKVDPFFSAEPRPPLRRVSPSVKTDEQRFSEVLDDKPALEAPSLDFMSIGQQYGIPSEELLRQQSENLSAPVLRPGLFDPATVNPEVLDAVKRNEMLKANLYMNQ